MKTNSDQHYDAIIIGTGPGGATLAHRLVSKGKRLLLLERGNFLPREKENWQSRDVFVESRYRAAEQWLDKEGKPFHPGIHYFVGGNSKVYGAALFRLRKEDFGELRHHAGISPAWPLSYEELAPYYLQAEQLYQVHGERGSDPTEPPEDAPYPHPAVSHEPRIAQLFHDFKALGRSPFPLPLGIMLDESHPHQSRCIRCNSCDGFPCLVNAKADAQVIAIDPLLDNERVTLKTGRCVVKLETDASGKEVKEVIALHGSTKESYSAPLIIVSCGAINSALLLLRSASERHPTGLANSSGLVGRHYMCHNNSAFLALSLEKNDTKFQKTLGLNDFYFGDEGFDFPLGHIQMLGKSDYQMLKGDAPPFTPGKVLDEMATHSLDFWMTSEDLPDPNNRVLINARGEVELHYQENNVEGHKRLQENLKGMLKAIGCQQHKLLPCHIYLGKKIPIAGTAHQCGTLRFGHDPKRSVLDPHCRAHDLENLYVVDGSCFPASGAVNPALTIMANALRVADHLLTERL